jgi:hypothetical protein
MSRDPWYSAGPDYGHPNKKSDGISFASDSWWSSDRGDLRQNNESGDGGLYDRAHAALNFGSNGRLGRLLARFNKFMRW